MFRLLLGSAVWRWLERMAEPEADGRAQPPATPQVSFAPREEAGTASSPTAVAPEELAYPKVERVAMGTLFEVYLAGPDRDALIGAGEEALDEIERLDRQLSHYRDDSDIARLNAHAASQWVRLEPQLYSLLKQCAELSTVTEGAFDVTTGPLLKLWGFHARVHRVPTDEEILEANESVGMGRVVFDDDDHLVLYAGPGVEVALGAIGKGYAIDQAAERLRFYGVTSALLHGGQSTIYALGAPPDTDSWELTLRDPRDHETPVETLHLTDEALSTSSAAEQWFEAGGKRYGHILDPRTGRPAEGVLCVWVVAPTAAESDALSTAFYVLGTRGAEEYCRSHPNIRAVMMVEDGAGGAHVVRIGWPTQGEEA